MKTRTTVLIIIGAFFIPFFLISGCVAFLDNDRAKDRIEYPLENVDINDTSTYMIVIERHNLTGPKYEVIADTKMIKDNKEVFCLDNKGAIYGTTSDGMIIVYKDGEHLDTFLYDSELTRNIEYGTLRFQPVNELDYQLLFDYDVFEQGENYTILINNNAEPQYYCSFAHGDDLHSLESVYFLDSTNNYDEIIRPQKINEDVLDFVGHFTDNEIEQTQHWYFMLSDCKLSKRYTNVKAAKDNLIAYAARYFDSDDSCIIVHDMFDKSVDYVEIHGDFPDPQDEYFLLSAEFTEDGKLRAEYIGKDGQVHNDIFDLG